MAAGIIEPAAVEVEIQTSQLTEPSALKDRFASSFFFSPSVFNQ